MYLTLHYCCCSTYVVTIWANCYLCDFFLWVNWLFVSCIPVQNLCRNGWLILILNLNFNFNLSSNFNISSNSHSNTNFDSNSSFKSNSNFNTNSSYYSNSKFDFDLNLNLNSNFIPIPISFPILLSISISIFKSMVSRDQSRVTSWKTWGESCSRYGTKSTLCWILWSPVYPSRNLKVLVSPLNDQRKEPKVYFRVLETGLPPLSSSWN